MSGKDFDKASKSAVRPVLEVHTSSWISCGFLQSGAVTINCILEVIAQPSHRKLEKSVGLTI